MPWMALLPMAVTVLVVYLGSALWSLQVSMTSSRTFPMQDFVGWAQYDRLFHNDRWLASLQNLAVYGLWFIGASMAIGTVLAIALDRRVRVEGVWRTVFLYPYALSFVATGLVWQWLFNPEAGLQAAVRSWGFESFVFDWIVDQDMVLYTVVIATVWQASGLVMALMLAALRSVEDDLWKATRIEGIPSWRVYVHIVLPMLKPMLATVFLLLFTAGVKVFDAVVAMTQGGPGYASDVPARFIMDHLFGRANIALASAGSMVLLAMVLMLVLPGLLARAWRSRGRA
jgi:glucose/mannose transport system permease protein